MFVLCTSIYMKFGHHLSSQRSLRKHTFNSKLDNLLRFLVHHFSQSGFFHTTNVIRMTDSRLF